MRLRSVAWSLLVAGAPCTAFPSSAHAAEPAGANGTRAADATEAARAHFKNGVKLYQDGDYTAALAEFDAAYELKPGPGSLQNVALCQKALFRYGEAADTLTRLLTRHDAELSDAERTDAKLARDELEALVGSVRLELSPPNADVTLDGRPLATAERASTLRLNAGEHTLAASAHGYTSASERIQVASGQNDVAVKLELTPSGEPGLSALPGPQASGVPAGAPASTQAKPATGWFGVGSVSLLASASAPFRFDLSKAQSSAWGLGVRGGHRLRPAVALAGLVELDVLKVRHACDEYAGELAPTPVLCGDPHAIVANYLVRSLRFGPTIELMSSDPHLRAVSALGVGAVWHQIRLGTDSKGGVDPFFLLEAGVGANSKHVLFALTAQVMLDGTRNMIDDRTLGPGASVHEPAFDRTNRTLAFVGINLRGGYSAWSP